MSSCRSGNKTRLGGRRLPRTRKPPYRALETKSRLARESIPQATRGRSRNAVPIETWAAEPCCIHCRLAPLKRALRRCAALKASIACRPASCVRREVHSWEERGARGDVLQTLGIFGQHRGFLQDIFCFKTVSYLDNDYLGDWGSRVQISPLRPILMNINDLLELKPAL